MHVTLFLYLSRSYLKMIGISLSAMAFLFTIIRFIDALRNASLKSSKTVGFIKIAQLVLIKLPYLLHETFPYIMFISAVLAFQALSRKNEYTILKASGISLWQFLTPFLITGFLLGVILITILNPISSSLLNYYKKEQAHLSGMEHMSFSLFDGGIWFVDKNLENENKRLVSAKFINIDKMELKNATFLTLNKNFNLVRRAYAQTAILADDEWVLNNAQLYSAHKMSEHLNSYKLSTKLQSNDIKNSLLEPETVSLWEMPYLIDNLNQAGFSSLKHLSCMYKILSKPLLIVCLILIAASFGLKSGAHVKTTRLIFYGLILGFAAFFLGELTSFLGNNGQLPPSVAVTLSILTIGIIGIAAIYHSDEV